MDVIVSGREGLKSEINHMEARFRDFSEQPIPSRSEGAPFNLHSTFNDIPIFHQKPHSFSVLLRLHHYMKCEAGGSLQSNLKFFLLSFPDSSFYSLS
jgi:hypothetical protein